MKTRQRKIEYPLPAEVKGRNLLTAKNVEKRGATKNYPPGRKKSVATCENGSVRWASAVKRRKERPRVERTDDANPERGGNHYPDGHA